MSDEILLIIGEDGKASLYDDTYDITIHCESKEEQDKVKRILQNEPHWIPVTERLPKEKDAGILKKLGKNKRSDYVIATVDVKGERMTVTACTYDGVWDWNMKYAFPEYEIVAWMPLPSPYQPKKEVTT